MLAKKYIQRLKLVTVFTGALLSQSVFAEHALPEFNANYAIQKFGIKLAEAHYQLEYTDTGYKFSESTNLYGVASMFRDDSVVAVSYVDKVGDQLLLKKHSYKQTGPDEDKSEDFSIQWDTSNEKPKGKVSGVARNREINLETDGAVWEVLSFQIPLMIEFNKNVKEYPYKALLKGELDTYNFVLNSSKKITFANKEYEVLQVIRTDPHKDRQLHIWLAPALHNMPMIVENYRDGKEHSRMQIESVQFANEKPLVDQLADNDDDF